MSPIVTTVDTPITGPIPCNDADVGDTLTYSVVTPPGHGTVVDNGDGSATYTPAAGYAGPDTFTFKANDGTVDSNVATAHLEVDTPPTCEDNHKTVRQGSSVVISFDTDFLCDDADAPPSLTILLDSDPAHGTLTDGPGNAVTYTPNPAFSGTDSFLYFAEDEFNIDSTDATMTITVTPKPVVTPPPPPPPRDTTPPSVGLAHAKQTIRNARAKGVALTETSSEAGRLSVAISVDKRTARKLRIKRNAHGRVVIGRLTQAIGAGQTTVHVRLTAKARKALKHVRKVKLLITVKVTDAAGNTTTKTVRLTLRR
jgi:hypothetical protein